MNELQKLAILGFITSILCILIGIINMIINDYFDFVFFIALSIIIFIISVYSYKRGVKKSDEKLKMTSEKVFKNEERNLSSNDV